MTGPSSPAESFRAALAPEIEPGDLAAVDSALDVALAAARASWPRISFDPVAVARHAGERVPPGAPASASLERLHLADLALACACASGQPAALSALDVIVTEQARAAAASARAGAVVADEAAQTVRGILVLPRSEKPPALHDYAGRGPLAGWIRITVAREVVRLLRRAGRAVELGDQLANGPAALSDPILSALKQRYRSELAEAFRAALAELTPRDRTMLRYQLVDGLGIDDIGAIHQVHRATAARWLSRIRDQLVDSTRAILADRLDLADEEARSVIRLVQSELDVSVIRHLDLPDDQR